MNLPPWLIVTGDFVPTGGMDMANLALARYLSESRPVEIVTHRVAEELAGRANLTAHIVPRPLNANVFGSVFLSRAGCRSAREIARQGGRVVVNGGNCPWHDINWLHYVHAAFRPDVARALGRRVKETLTAVRSRARERATVARSRLVICNSRFTARHAVELLQAREETVRVIYYGIDATRFPVVGPAEKQAARRELQWEERPWAVFIGSLGDNRKGFDRLYAAWKRLCQSSRWDANLAVVGCGASLPHWRERSEADGLTGRVILLGFRTDVHRILTACDLMVHPARYEAYGLVVQEAVSTGLPVLVSANAGVAERFSADLSDLLIANPNDPHELVERLTDWRANLESWPSRIAGLTAVIRGRTWDHMAEEIVDAAHESAVTANATNGTHENTVLVN